MVEVDKKEYLLTVNDDDSDFLEAGIHPYRPNNTRSTDVSEQFTMYVQPVLPVVQSSFGRSIVVLVFTVNRLYAIQSPTHFHHRPNRFDGIEGGKNLVTHTIF